jgi:hypothetical protein
MNNLMGLDGVNAITTTQTPPIQTPPIQTPPIQTPPIQTPPIQTPPIAPQYTPNELIAIQTVTQLNEILRLANLKLYNDMNDPDAVKIIEFDILPSHDSIIKTEHIQISQIDYK